MEEDFWNYVYAQEEETGGELCMVMWFKLVRS